MQEHKEYQLKRRSYVIRSSRISIAQKKAYKELSQYWVIPNEMAMLDWSVMFDKNDGMRIVEIGFGMGDATRNMACEHPNWNILAIEMHKPGIGKLLWHIEKDDLKNIRIIEADAIEVVGDRLEPESVDAFHIWFPDPWPKKKHHKRRLVQLDFMNRIAAKLKMGGYVHIVTDWANYADHIMQVLQNTQNMQNRFKGWAPKQEYRPKTKFERLAIHKGLKVKDIIFEKCLNS